VTAGRTTDRLAGALTTALDQATYAGYRAGFEAARAQAARLAHESGDAVLAQAITALAPLPDRGREDPGRG
jgi:hypothetical protein